MIEVDSLRGLAAVGVMLFHTTTRFDQLFIHRASPPFAVSWGALGVNLFFMISGFVIFMTLDRTEHPTDFVVSRVSRLYPAYWAALAITVSFERLTHLPGAPLSVGHAAANLLMFHNIFDVPHVDSVYWTLEVELLFYLAMFGLWLAGWLAYPIRVIVGWLALTAFFAFSDRVFGVEIPYIAARFLILKYFAYFAVGMALYLIHRRRFRAVWREVLTIVFALAVIGASEGWARALWVTGFATLFTLALIGRAPWLRCRVLVWLGAISYPLYLIHESLGWAVILAFESYGVTTLASIAVAISLALSLATLLHLLVEKPVMNAIRARYRRLRASFGKQPTAQRVRSRWLIGVGATALGLLIGNRLSLLAAPAPAAPLEPRVEAVGMPTPCTYAGAATPSVLLVLGQSNAANHSQSGIHVGRALVFSHGACWDTTDPLPGGTGRGASIWTALAERIRARGVAEPVFAINAVASTRVHQWASPGPLRDGLDTLLDDLLHARLMIAAVIWQQGEADALASTSAEDYVSDLHIVIAHIRARGVDAPVFIGLSTDCKGDRYGVIRRALERVVATTPGTQLGADIDAIGAEHRFDNCHLGPTGRHEAARRWESALVATGVLRAQP